MADYLDTKVEQMDHDFGTPESTKAYKKATPGQNEAKREDTPTAVARAMTKMGVKYDRKKEKDIISKIPKVLDSMKLSSGEKRMLMRDRDFIADVLDGLGEAREIDTKAMSAYMKYAKAKKVDNDSIRMAFDNPNHPESKRMMKNKNFATALKMYKASGK